MYKTCLLSTDSVSFVSPLPTAQTKATITGSSQTKKTVMKEYITEISASAVGGPRSQACARETLRSAPIDVSGNFPAHVSAESPSNISPNPSEVISEVSEPYDNPFWGFEQRHQQEENKNT